MTHNIARYNFSATKQKVHNRRPIPEDFLYDLIEWGASADEEIFLLNENSDIYGSVFNVLGPWRGNLHRRAVMLEVLRVLAGFESSWDWNCGVDTTNPNSNTSCTEEAGILQCSGDSMRFSPSLKKLLADFGGDGSCLSFIKITKANKNFALEYCARLLRFTCKHHGPIRDGHIHEWLRRDAVEEFMQLLGNSNFPSNSKTIDA